MDEVKALRTEVADLKGLIEGLVTTLADHVKTTGEKQALLHRGVTNLQDGMKAFVQTVATSIKAQARQEAAVISDAEKDAVLLLQAAAAAIRAGKIVAIKGLGGYDSSEGLPPENVGKSLAQNFPEIDVLLLGHTHTEIKEMFENGVLISQADKYGDMLSLVNLELEKKNNKWQIINKKSETISVKNIEPDKELMEKLSKEHQNTIDYVNSSIGESDKELLSKLGRLEDTEIVDLINYVQLKITGADISAASLFNEEAIIPKGNITIANVAGLYLYENTLFSIKVTGKQLLDWLEIERIDSRATDIGTFNLNVSGNYLDRLTFIPTPGADVTNKRGEMFAPTFSANVDLAWTMGAVTVNYGLSWFDRTLRYTNQELIANPDSYAPEYTYVKALWQHDLSAKVEVAPGFEFYGGVRNVFDQKPELATRIYPVSAVGRTMFAGFRAKM